MREILFRAKRKDNGQWVYGVPITSGNMAVMYYPTKVCVCEQTVDINTIGQFTGLKDKNGNKVFEGDVVRWADFTMEIFWGRDVGIGYGFCWKPCGSNKYYKESMTGFINEYEVIGNIFDNKEL
jgi:uncharacterized phage protein (TIGR01671 family)